MSDDTNIPINSAEEEYKSKTAPYSRDIDEVAVGPQGPKGDTGDTGPQGPAGANGADGADAPQVQAEYSSDGTNWHSTYNPLADKYIRFSYDGGTTWDTAVIVLVGEKGDTGNAAPNLQVQYSTNNIDWENTPTSPTDYIRFSLDGGSTWEAGLFVSGEDGTNGTNAPEVQINYSSNGIDWHTSFNSGVDTYIRFSVDGGSTWLVSDVFIGSNGTNGTNGTNAYLYIAYADDDQGNGFTLTFSDTKDYIALLQSTTEITSPVVGDFTGLWKYMAGTTGDAGQNAYCYVAYASADDGSDFSLSPGATLDYIAILSTPTYKNPPVQADFNGLWKKYKGDNGSNASYIELPSATTVHGRITAGIIEQPTGWTIDSGDQISNPLSSNPVDLVIYHNTDKEVVDVVIKSKTADHQIKLIGAAAYSTFLDDDTKKYLCIKSFSETETILGIYILFES